MSKFPLQEGSSAWNFVTQQSFPEPNRKAQGNFLLGLQSDTPSVKVVRFFCDKETMNFDGIVLFSIVPSPISPLFRLEFTPFPLPTKNPSFSDNQKYKQRRMVAEFLAYDPETTKNFQRNPYRYTSKDGNSPPTESISFSSKLRDVQYSSGDRLPDTFKNSNAEAAGKEHGFRWRAQTCNTYGFDQPVPSDMQAKAKNFKEYGLKGSQ